MPVNAGAAGAFDTPHPHNKRRGQFGVGLVFLVVLDHAQLVTDMLGRPMALLAGVAGRAQFVQRGRHRRRIQVERDRHHLPGAVEFRLDEPVGTGADMALGAGNAGMR